MFLVTGAGGGDEAALLQTGRRPKPKTHRSRDEHGCAKELSQDARFSYMLPFPIFIKFGSQ